MLGRCSIHPKNPRKISAMKAKYLYLVLIALVPPALFVVAIGVLVHVLTWIRGAKVDWVVLMVWAAIAYICMLVVGIKILMEYKY